MRDGEIREFYIYDSRDKFVDTVLASNENEALSIAKEFYDDSTLRVK